uniref:Uncharacterized protein n=1 Tax=Aegilops tauschii subsp. strangulata TaxID=200361 RepID=A0A453E8W4_AEGTS
MILRWTIDVGWASTWVRVGNEWLAAITYSKCERHC